MLFVRCNCELDMEIYEVRTDVVFNTLDAYNTCDNAFARQG